MKCNQPSRRGVLGGLCALLSGLFFANKAPAVSLPDAPLPPGTPGPGSAAASLTDVSGDVTTFVYDADDDNASCLARIDPSGLVTTFAYDDRNPS